MVWIFMFLFCHSIMVLNTDCRSRRTGSSKYEVFKKSEGATLKLICRGRNSQVRWLKDSMKITAKPDGSVRFRRRGKQLIIQSIKKSDAGTYVCKNRITKKNMGKFKVVVKELSGKPVFVDQSRMNRMSLSVLIHSAKVQFPCTAEGYMPIQYKWLKDNKPVKRRRVNNKMNASHPVLKLYDLVTSDNGNYTCLAWNKFGKISHTFQLVVTETTKSRPVLQPGLPRNRSVQQYENTTLNCRDVLGGMGMADFRWYHWNDSPPGSNDIKNLKDGASLSSSHNGTLIETKYHQTTSLEIDGDEHHRVALPLTNITLSDAGWYSCIACNYIGCSIESAYVEVLSVQDQITTESSLRNSTKPKDKDDSVLVKILLVVFGLALLVCVMVMARKIWTMTKKAKLNKGKDENNGIDRETENHNTSTTELNNGPKGSVVAFSRTRLISNSSVINPTTPLLYHESLWQNGQRQKEFNELDEIICDEEAEIDREFLAIGETLGEGAFGVVVKAEALGLSHKTEKQFVAVKMLKADATENELLDLLYETKIMKQIGRHKNIINFVGYCVKNGPLFVVVEYAPYGNLRQFLRSRRPTYPDSTEQKPEPVLNLQNLVSFSLQISKGMEFLASKLCIHRDLAARNVLVGEDYTMKIADFGLARTVREADYYRKTTNGRLPVKWLAIEALFDRVYTTQSDVWAFGVLLWEIFTLGGSPYPGIPVERLFDLLKLGYRMESPQGCPKDIYEIFLECWYENPNDRPSFSDLCNKLEANLERLASSDYLEILADMPLKMESQEDSDDLDFSQRLISEGDDGVFEDSNQENSEIISFCESSHIEESNV